MKTTIILCAVIIAMILALQICVPIIDRAQERTAARYGTFVSDNSTVELIRI